MGNIKRSGDYLIGDTREASEAYRDMFKSPNQASVDIKQAADMMKKLLEMEDLVSKKSRGTRAFSIDRLEAGVAANKAKIEQLKKEQDLFDKALAFAATLPFKVGDAAFHKEYGNVLISNILMDDNLSNDTTQYVIITNKGSQREVPMKEVMPISEATKILFGKK